MEYCSALVSGKDNVLWVVYGKRSPVAMASFWSRSAGLLVILTLVVILFR